MDTLSSHVAAHLSVNEVIAKLNSDYSTGLTEGDVLARRKIFGWNEFDITDSVPLWKKYLEQVRIVIDISVDIYSFNKVVLFNCAVQESSNCSSVDFCHHQYMYETI